MRAGPRGVQSVSSPPSDMDFPEVLRQFDDFMEATGLSSSTRHTYRYQLVLLWCDFLLDVGLEVQTVSSALLDRYLADMNPHGSKRGDAMRAMKAFFVWGEDRIRPDNPAAHMKVPRARVGDAPDLSDEYIRRLLRALFHRDPRRGWATMLCFATGCRVGSLVAVVPTDVDLRRERITFRVAKNDRPYTVPLVGLGLVAARHLVAEILSPSDATLVGVGAARFAASVSRLANPSRVSSPGPPGGNDTMRGRRGDDIPVMVHTGSSATALADGRRTISQHDTATAFLANLMALPFRGQGQAQHSLARRASSIRRRAGAQGSAATVENPSGSGIAVPPEDALLPRQQPSELVERLVQDAGEKEHAHQLLAERAAARLAGSPRRAHLHRGHPRVKTGQVVAPTAA